MLAADVEQKKNKITVFVHTFHVRAFSGWWGLPSPFMSQIFGGLLTSFVAQGFRGGEGLMTPFLSQVFGGGV